MPQNEESKETREHKDPVGWLFGRDLIASMKTSTLYTAFGAKIDARAWMSARAFKFGDHYVTTDEETGEREFWFDYISDTGDSTRATYSVAYLAMSNLYVKSRFTERPAAEADRDVFLEHVMVRAETGKDVSPEHAGLKAENLVRLPRGKFLFVGGDTTYHMSDYPGLSNRFQNPFRWAAEDLEKDVGTENFDKTRRRLFGIPGNHDYYDLLDGFRRQFRRPVREDLRRTYQEGDSTGPQLQIPGYIRQQEASYVALKLPFGWWMWGLDTDVGKIDERQQEFFKSLVGDGKTADRLIVATSAPTTVFGQYAKPKDEKASRAFYALGVPRPFLPDGHAGLEKDEVRLRDDQCRLDLSGDVHQYARYWGNDTPPSKDTPPRKGSKISADPKRNYASVVSGLGGAFLHPTMTYRGEVREQVLYPTEDTSRKTIAGKVFNPWKILKGGWVHAIGFIMAFVIYFGATHVQSSRQAVSAFVNLPVLRLLHIAAPEPITPTMPSDAPAAARQTTDAGRTGAASVEPRYFWGPNARPKATGYVWSLVLLGLSVPFVILAVLLMEMRYKKFVELDEGVARELNKLASGKSGARGEDYGGETGAGSRGGAAVMEADPKKVILEDAKRKNAALVLVTKVWLYALVAASFILIVSGVLLILPHRDNNTPFGSSVIVLFSIIWAVCAFILSMRYSDWLFEQTSKRTVEEREWWVTGVLYVFAVLCLGAGIWVFGKNNLPAYLLSDIIFFVTLVAAFAILIYVLPLIVGAGHNSGGEKALLVVFGVWHAILQIFVPFMLVRKGTWLTLLLAAVVVLFFSFVVGPRVMKKYREGWPLLACWLVYGVIMLALPWLVLRSLTWLIADRNSPLWLAFWPTEPGARWLASFRAYEWWAPYNGMVEPVNGWWGLVPALLAGGVGLWMCCSWFGWYLGVASLFNSHYNEAGAAARIEGFKQFVRIKVTENTLTGYVIAVDESKEAGRELKPCLVDVFHLEARKSP